MEVRFIKIDKGMESELIKAGLVKPTYFEKNFSFNFNSEEEVFPEVVELDAVLN
jgi:hypothetical protein